MSTSARNPLENLRSLLDKNGVGLYVVLTQDEHNSEYVAEADQRRAFISGFTGSAGTAVIGQNFAELATDGRYFLQAEKQLGPEWTLRKEGSPDVSPWSKAIIEKAKELNSNIGVDPKLIQYSIVQGMRAQLEGTQLEVTAIEKNLVDEVWPNKPQLPQDPVYELDVSVTGESFQSKLKNLRKQLETNGAQAIVLFELDEIAWLFNLRGSDVQYNPVFKSFAIISHDSACLYIDQNKIGTLSGEYSVVDFKPYNKVYEDAHTLGLRVLKEKEAGFVREDKCEAIWIPAGASWALNRAFDGCKVISTISPVKIAKSVKNEVELDGSREAYRKCGLSIVRYLSWLERELDAGQKITEYEGSMKLLEIREQLADFRGLSFDTISSVGPNAAIIHYSPSPEGNTLISKDKIYLLDSGCQFTHGTTDTTRTVHFGTPTDEERLAYTLVLKGHIALARAVFPQGTNGYQLDPLARQYLWKYGLDYRHGTGHGIGSFLNVHEGPMGISSGVAQVQQPLCVGNVISNEPGYYKDGHFGVRIESVVVVRKAATPNNFAGKNYLEFETITLVPYDRKLIDEQLLDAGERDWVNKIHERTRSALHPHLNDEERRWLAYHTQPI